MLSPITLAQFERVKERYPDAQLEPLTSGSGLLTLPEVALPAGWSLEQTPLYFIVPAGYPGPAPDCFWVDQRVALAGGGAPQASNVTQIPETPITGRWFSWHVVEANNNWNPNRDDLLTYVKICLDRLQHVK